MESISIQGLLERIAYERALKLSDKLSDYAVPLEVLTATNRLESKADALADKIEVVNGCLGDYPSGESVRSQLAMIPSSISTLQSAVSSKISKVNEMLRATQSSINDVQDAVGNVATRTENLVTGLDDRVAKAMDELDESITRTKSDLVQMISDIKSKLSSDLEVLTSQFKTELGVTSSELALQVKDVERKLSSIMDKLQTTVDDNVLVKLTATLDSLKSLQESLDAVAAFSEKWDSEGGLPQIKTQVSAYYQTYAELTANVMTLERQVVENYKRWMDEAALAANRQLEAADLLDSVDRSIKGLAEHESKLDYITGQFDKLLVVSNQIQTLAALWEADHDTINDCVMILKKHQAADITEAAGNIGAALTGVADIISATKPVKQKTY